MGLSKACTIILMSGNRASGGQGNRGNERVLLAM